MSEQTKIVPSDFFEQAQKEYGYTGSANWKDIAKYLNLLGFQILYDPKTQKPTIEHCSKYSRD